MARAKMWCVRVGEELRASNTVENLRKYLSNPKARFGVWVEIKWLDMADINSYKNGRAIGFFDLDSGQFYKSLRKDYSAVDKFVGDVHISADEKAVVDAIWEHMRERWRKKFKKDQQI